MSDQGFISQDDANKKEGVIVKTGDDWVDGKVATGETVDPGAVVVRDSNGDFTEAAGGATDVTGVAPERTVDDRLAVDEQASQLDPFQEGEYFTAHRGGVKFMGTIASGNGTITNDTKLKAAANGELQPLASGDDPELVVAKYIGEDDVDTSGGSQRALCRWDH